MCGSTPFPGTNDTFFFLISISIAFYLSVSPALSLSLPIYLCLSPSCSLQFFLCVFSRSMASMNFRWHIIHLHSASRASASDLVPHSISPHQTPVLDTIYSVCVRVSYFLLFLFYSLWSKNICGNNECYVFRYDNQANSLSLDNKSIVYYLFSFGF